MSPMTRSWPLPDSLQFSPEVSALAQRAVELRLLDGELMYGHMPADEDLAQQTQLRLSWRGQDIVIAVSEIRSVACTDLLEVAAGLPGQAAPAPSSQTLRHFDVMFADGESLSGQTLGLLNQKNAGVYLYVQQDALYFKALWIPRAALKGLHIKTPEAADRGEAVASVLAPCDPAPRAGACNMHELAAWVEAAPGKPMLAAAQALFELHVLDRDELLELQGDKSGKLRAYIDQRLAASDKFRLQLEHARAYMVNTPEVDAERFEIEPQALRKISWSVATKQSVLPLGILSETLYLASSSPTSRELEHRLSMIVGGHIALVWASEAQILARLAAAPAAPELPSVERADSAPLATGTSSEPEVQDLQELLISARNEIRVEGVEVRAGPIDEHSSVVRLVKRIIVDAHQRQASDIHVETNAGDQVSRVRFRIDGDLEEYLRLPPDLRAALVSRIKVMSKLDISERRRPQDGKINFAEYSNVKLELRVAILPTHDNLEDVVMRLLGASKPMALARLGFSAHDIEIVSRIAQRPYGMILACGPTGSGKTTTLHSLLNQINTDNRKIWTAEDPIEITQPGLRQLQVNPKIGVTFASAMRAFLRADPDVIMIGEIRDEETASIAVEASLTGHLVLSTLHTNNAAESIMRLLDLGMEAMNFADSLVGIVAQRLLRMLCPHCKRREALPAERFEALAQSYVEGTVLELEEARKRLLHAARSSRAQGVGVYQALGCEACSGKGYKGRCGIYETLESNAQLRHLIQTRAPTSAIFQQAIANGMRSLKQDALEKVFAGTIDLKQALTVYN
jgi:type II secretory ATPase GspE/PulE/Tfp pilus assembly ATPase PilB-like protein